jgi:glucose/arabinose dehydrogenase
MRKLKIKLVAAPVALAAILGTGVSRHMPGACLASPNAKPTKFGTKPITFGDYHSEAPGVVHQISVADLPAPYSTDSADNNPDVVSRPANAWPQVLPGFKVELYAAGLDNPRLMRTAPNGDVFLAESQSGKVRVFRGISSSGAVVEQQVFAGGLRQPFGIAFYPPGPDPEWVYVGDTDAVLRFPYRAGDMKARGARQKIADLPAGGSVHGGGHWTRDIAFSADGRKMYVSVGSHSNVDDADTHPAEFHRADILEFNPDGTGLRVFAWGIRNPVGIAVSPKTGELWASVNERDQIGDNLPPDYITHIADGGFYGWPWFYTGGHPDPRLAGKHPELKDKVIVPDVLLQPHNASLEMMFYQGNQFPKQYEGQIFAAEHGSWNRAVRTGYELILVPVNAAGRAERTYQDFLTGFVTAEGKVWGRPVGVTQAKDGSLLVSDDAGRVIWRIEYTGK